MRKYQLHAVLFVLPKSRFCGASRQIVLLLLLSLPCTLLAQNVGVGTANPLRRLSVAGSLMIDQNSNNYGSLDSAALVFGNAGNSGISSRKNGPEPHNLTFWAGGLPYMSLSPTGNLGLGGGYNAVYRLWVRNGNSRFDGTVYAEGDVWTDGNAALGGDVDPQYRLRVWGGNSRFGGDLHATGNVAFGGLPDANYRLRVNSGNVFLEGGLRTIGNAGIGGAIDNTFRLRVYGGDSRFENNVQIGDNLQVMGTATASSVTVNNTLTIAGKGSVRSNGPSSLRIGFDSKVVDVLVNGNEAVTVPAAITDFTGDNDDVRVFVSQIELNAGSTMFLSSVHVNVTNVNAAADTCDLRIRNLSGASATLKATIYLTTIAKN